MRTDKRTGMMKLLVAFLNLRTGQKNKLVVSVHGGAHQCFVRERKGRLKGTALNDSAGTAVVVLWQTAAIPCMFLALAAEFRIVRNYWTHLGGRWAKFCRFQHCPLSI